MPEGGAIFKRAYFRLWPSEEDGHVELPQFDRVTQSWDCAIKDNETSSFSVCTTWGECEQGYFLLDVWRQHVEFPEMMHAMQELAHRGGPTPFWSKTRPLASPRSRQFVD